MTKVPEADRNQTTTSNHRVLTLACGIMGETEKCQISDTRPLDTNGGQTLTASRYTEYQTQIEVTEEKRYSDLFSV